MGQKGTKQQVHVNRSNRKEIRKEEVEKKKQFFTDRPIVGIYSLPYHGNPSCGVIPACYVKWIESAGGRVVPLPCSMTLTQVQDQLNCLNGLVFTGGSHPVTSTARLLLQVALAFNKKNDFFPVWGTCLGFEWILQMIGDVSPDQFEHGLDAEDYVIPLHFTPYGKKESRLFSQASPVLKQVLSCEKVTYNHHKAGLAPETFYENKTLQNFFHLVSTNTDRKGRLFLSTIEGKKFPIYGSQWHSEKVMYDFSSNPNFKYIPHTPKARWVSQYVVDFFVDECKKSSHTFLNSKSEDEALIYNYPVTKRPGTEFVPVYYFNW